MHHIIQPPTRLTIQRILNLLLDFERRLLRTHLQRKLINQIVDAFVVVQLGDASCHHHREHVDDDVGVLTDEVVGDPTHILELFEGGGVLPAHYVGELGGEQEGGAFWVRNGRYRALFLVSI